MKVLVLLPDAADDPAGREALEVVEIGVASGALAVEAVAWEGGPLLTAMRRPGPVSVVADLPGGAASVVERALVRAHLPAAGFAVRRRRLGIGPWGRHRPDAVYLTSPRAAPLLRALPSADRPTVVVMVPAGEMTEHVHEPLSDEDRSLLLGAADRFVVQTEETRVRLLGLGVPEGAIVRIGAPRPDARPDPPAPEERAALRQRLGLADGTPVIAGTGPLVWQGGADLFVRTLWLLRERCGVDVAGVWVGAEGDPLERRQLDHDITHMGLADHLHVLGPADEDALWLADVQVVTSREVDDPELHRPAGERGQALVGFRTGPLERFVDGVDGDAGRLFDFLDLEGLARAIADLLADDVARDGLAGRVARRYDAWHVPAQRTAYLLGLLRPDR